MAATPKANLAMGFKGPVFNDYTEEEKEQRIAWCEEVLQEIETERASLQEAFLKAQKKYGSLMDRSVALSTYREDVAPKIMAFENRIQQIRDKDPEGRFVVPCFEIEQKLGKFKSQIGLAVDKPPQRIHNESPSSPGNMYSMFSAFSKPST